MPRAILAFLFAVAAIAGTSSASHAGGIAAATADDVCSSSADPCTVTDVVSVASGATLDFSNRALTLSGHGRLDFGSGSGRVVCGSMNASTDGDAIVAAGPATGGGTAGGTVTIEARRLCSAGSPAATCLNEFGCQLGTCTARRCSARTSVHCGADADCAGTCTSHRCANSALFVRCATNADCDFGTCPEQLTCASNSGTARNCASDADCDLGSCSVGTASIDIEGSIEGRSASPGAITLHAADAVTLRGDVELSATSNEESGGDLRLVSESGDAVVEGTVRARGGGFGTGGSVEVTAGHDARVAAAMNLTGGDSDGGSLDMTAERDAVLDSDLNVSSTSGSGYGGTVTMDAGRDILIGTGAVTRRIMANGHTDHENSGDGGYFDLYADGDVAIAAGIDIRARGARSEGFGGTLDVAAGGGFTLAGRFDGRSRGKYGGGGSVYVYTNGDIKIPESGTIDLRSTDGGEVDLSTDGGDFTFAGSLLMSGLSDESGAFRIEACRVTFAGTIDNEVIGGYSQLIGYQSLHVLPAGRLLTPNGDNFLTYSVAEPVIEGTVTPTAVLAYSGYYGDCPVCGNSVIDDGETCDDGNTAAGDGCDDLCQLE